MERLSCWYETSEKLKSQNDSKINLMFEFHIYTKAVHGSAAKSFINGFIGGTRNWKMLWQPVASNFRQLRRTRGWIWFPWCESCIFMHLNCMATYQTLYFGLISQTKIRYRSEILRAIIYIIICMLSQHHCFKENSGWENGRPVKESCSTSQMQLNS